MKLISRNSLRFFSTIVGFSFASSCSTVAGVDSGFLSPRYLAAPMMHLRGSYVLVSQNVGGNAVQDRFFAPSSSFFILSFENENVENWYRIFSPSLSRTPDGNPSF